MTIDYILYIFIFIQKQLLAHNDADFWLCTFEQETNWESRTWLSIFPNHYKTLFMFNINDITIWCHCC